MTVVKSQTTETETTWQHCNLQHRFPKCRHYAREGGCRRQPSNPKTAQQQQQQNTREKNCALGENSSDTHVKWSLFSLRCTAVSILVFLKVGQHTEPNTKVQGPGSCGPASAFIPKGPRNFPGCTMQALSGPMKRRGQIRASQATHRPKKGTRHTRTCEMSTPRRPGLQGECGFSQKLG